MTPLYVAYIRELARLTRVCQGTKGVPMTEVMASLETLVAVAQGPAEPGFTVQPDGTATLRRGG